MCCSGGVLGRVCTAPPPRHSALPPLQEDGLLCTVLGSIEAVSPQEGGRSTCRYINKHWRFAFDINANSKLLEHKWGSTSITYVPVCPPPPRPLSGT